jgi:hypothetical protein
MLTMPTTDSCFAVKPCNDSASCWCSRVMPTKASLHSAASRCHSQRGHLQRGHMCCCRQGVDSPCIPNAVCTCYHTPVTPLPSSNRCLCSRTGCCAASGLHCHPLLRFLLVLLLKCKGWPTVLERLPASSHHLLWCCHAADPHESGLLRR